MSKIRRLAPVVLFCLSVAFVPVAALRAGEPLPKTSKDGLELRKQTKQWVVYVKPGAKVSQYESVTILDPYIEFAKNWVRDYNSSTRGATQKITDRDLEKAKEDLSTQFKTIFREEVTKAGYEV